MKTMRKLLFAALLAALCAASADALTIAEVAENSTEYAGKLATVMLPRGWKKGTFDSSSWLDFKAPVGSITTKTVRFDKKTLFAHSEDEFLAKVADMAAKEGAPLQKFTIDDVPFVGWVVPSTHPDRRVRGVKYDLRLWADWPRKEEPRDREYRDAMLIEVNERPLLGPEDRPRLRPDQVGELLKNGMLPDVEVMFLLQSIRFADSEGKRYHARFAQLRAQAEAARTAADATLKLAAMGRLVGTWVPAELRWNGRVLAGAEMEEAAASHLRTITFSADGTYTVEPADRTWKVNDKGGYTLGDASGRLWVENNGLVNFRDADGYHFVFRKLPSEFPSDAELLAIALGDWTPVEIIAEGRSYMGSDLNRAASAARMKLAPLSVRPDGTLYDGRRFGSWKLDNAQITFSHDDFKLALVRDHLEQTNDAGVRLIYARRGEEARFRSVFMRELIESEKIAAETEPIVGFWRPEELEENGQLVPRGPRSESIMSMLHRLWFRSNGDISIDGRVCGKWRADAAQYIIELREGARSPVMSFDGTALRREHNSTLTVVYKKEPWRQ